MAILGNISLYAVAAVVLLGVLISFHELGHFLCAKLMGVKVERFAIGLGPTVWSRKYGETEYILAAIPFGGYIKMLGEDTSLEDVGQEDVEPPSEADLERAFDRQPVWKRSAIIFMGPLFNIVLAFIVFTMVFAVYGVPVALPFIGAVAANTPAAEAGLMGGDEIISIDGTLMKTWADVPVAIRGNPEKALQYVIKREDKEFTVYVKPEKKVTTTPLFDEIEDYFIGISMSDKVRHDSVSLITAVSHGTTMTVKSSKMIFEVLVKLIKRVIPADTLGGPILIFQMAGQQAQKGFADYMWLLAFISVNLGVMNLLPIPVLDGGHLVFMGIEAIRRKPLSEAVIMNAQKVGLVLLLMLMVFATYNDIIRLFTGKLTP